ncbi:unnamed protein product [Gongylonema pulchrum]|uniref:Uncharacterized protein n=1 Tax=Gongylonema pulchrum TaxID=637853 RepID=A0A183EH47_9BILA|nr:unnamed protein product [Gongylonema pulchrum]
MATLDTVYSAKQQGCLRTCKFCKQREPTSAELLTLLEKQDEVLSALHGELEICKSEMAVLRGTKSAQLNDDGAQPNTAAHIDRLNEIIEEERNKRSEEFAKLNSRLTEKTMECGRLITENVSIKARLKALEDANSAKETLVSDLTRRLASESAKREEEDKALATRLYILADENATLRTSLLALGASNTGPSKRTWPLMNSKLKKIGSSAEDWWNVSVLAVIPFRTLFIFG